MSDEDFKVINRIYNDILFICTKTKDCKKCVLVRKDVYGNKLTCLAYETNLIYHDALKEKPERINIKNRIT